MDWKEKYARNVEFLNNPENAGLAATLTAMSCILRQEQVDYSIMHLGDFCQSFVGKDKGQLLIQLQRFAENGWFINQEVDHIALLEKALHDAA